MIGQYNVEKIKSFIKDIYTVVGIRISIFDSEFNVVTEYPTTSPKLCSMIRSQTEGKKACHRCDTEACNRAKKLLAPHVYQCHAGITEAITPLQLGGGILGYAIFAHMMPEENYTEAAQNVLKLVSKYGFNPQEIGKAINDIPRYSTDKIMASIRLLDAVAYYLQIQNVVVWKADDISSKLKEYVENNLSNNIDASTLCRAFYISRTKLYMISKKTFGMGIGEYILSRKLYHAKHLLKTSEESVSSIARVVGCDYNYFCKLFKKYVGVSPLAYRKTIE